MDKSGYVFIGLLVPLVAILAVGMYLLWLMPEQVAACASLLTVVIAVVAVMCAIKAVRLAEKTLKPTEKALQLALVTRLTDTYSSTEMSRGLIEMRKWERKNPDDFAQKFRELREDDDRYEQIRPVDEGRRLFAHYMYEVGRLRNLHVMTKEEEELLVHDSQVVMLFEVCKPLEKEVASAHGWAYDEKTFNYFKPRWQRLNKNEEKQNDTTAESAEGE